MFKNDLITEMTDIKNAKNKLDNVIQAMINNHAGNKALQSVQKDFQRHFHPIMDRLVRIHEWYSLCSRIFDSIYASNLQKVASTNDETKLKKFQNIVKDWERKFQVNYMAAQKINTAHKKINQFADENSTFFSVLNEAKEHGSIVINENAWEAAKNEASAIYYNIIMSPPKKSCEKLSDEFTKTLQNFVKQNVLKK